MQKTHWYSRAQSGKFWCFDNCGSQSSLWRKWISKQSSRRRCVTRLGTHRLQSYPTKTTSQENAQELAKVSGADKEIKGDLHDNSLEFGKSCEELCWNHFYVNTTQIGNEWDCWDSRAVRRAKWRDICLVVVVISGWIMVVWIWKCHCYMRNAQDPSMGRRSMKGVSEYHLMARLFHLEQWSNITLFRRKTSREPHQFGPTVLPGAFLGYVSCAVWKLERRRYGRKHWRLGDDGRVWNPRQKAQCKGKCWRRRKVKCSFSQSQMEQLKFLEVNVWHPPWSGTAQTKNKVIFEENQTSSLLQHHNKMTPHWMMRKLEMISDLLQEISFVAITWKPWVKLYVPTAESFLVPPNYIDVARTTHTTPLGVMMEKILMIVGIWMERELSDAWTGFTRFILLNERPLDAYTWSGWDSKGN